jgi:hypothetical protein
LERYVPEHGILGNFSDKSNKGVNMYSNSLSGSDAVLWVVEEALGKHNNQKMKCGLPVKLKDKDFPKT